MSRLQRQLYRGMVRLHPGGFRRRFGREMLLDFEEADGGEGFGRLVWDAVVSVGRQWAVCIVSGEDEIAGDEAHSLLSGHYVMIRDRGLDAREWSRGLLASVALVAGCGSLIAVGARTAPRPGVVYAAMQAVASGQGNSAPDAAGDSQRFTQFDVASVREDKGSGAPHVNFPLGSSEQYVSTHGYMQALDLPLPAYIQFAYKMNALEIVALNRQLPDWAVSTRYDIEARAEGDPTKDEMRRMVRALLASRFKLQLRTETTLGNVYELEVANAGKLGPNLHLHASADPNCSEAAAKCGHIGFAVPDPGRQVVRMTGEDVSLDQLLFYATTQMGRPVLNKTGLAGRYDFTLEYAQQRYNQTPGDVEDDGASPTGQTFADAVRDQLGLKLVAAKGPVASYVLEHIERPSEN